MTTATTSPSQDALNRSANDLLSMRKNAAKIEGIFTRQEVERQLLTLGYAIDGAYVHGSDLSSREWLWRGLANTMALLSTITTGSAADKRRVKQLLLATVHLIERHKGH